MHFASQDCCLGKGIAMAMKKNFSELKKLAEQEKGVGYVAIVKDGHHFVYSLVTNTYA